MKKLIYIGSPYSHPDDEIRHNNFKIVSEFAAQLCSEGYVAFSPITYGHTLLDFKEMSSSWEFWQTFCLSFLVHADELIVYQMPGWENSKGLSDEISFARDHGIKITYVKYNN